MAIRTAAVLFETSGEVRRALQAAGVPRVTSYDLLPNQDGEAGARDHVIVNVRALLAEWREWPAAAPDLVIAHPPCTYLCNSGVRWLTTIPRVCKPGTLYGGGAPRGDGRGGGALRGAADAAG